jgi:hypothetical protein
MKNFEEFVKHIVSKWRVEKQTILESQGLGMPANRIIGDLAEKYIVSKINKLSPKYSSFIANGSQTPADIYSVARRDGYWHIMLTQVKCSASKDAIYELNKTEVEQFAALAKFIKAEIVSFGLLDPYKIKSVIISIGYAGVHTTEVGGSVRHRTVKVKPYKLFRINFGKLDIPQTAQAVNKSHDLGIKKKVSE